jgi:hypothetical protein
MERAGPWFMGVVADRRRVFSHDDRMSQTQTR